MVNNLYILDQKKKRKQANKWDDVKARMAELNPLGQRLLQLVLDEKITPREFSQRAELGDNLESQFTRMGANRGPMKGLSLEQAVAYAKYAKVSFAWLVTGEGTRNDGLYSPGVEEMRRLPEKLARATRALMDLDGVPSKSAMYAAEQVYLKEGDNEGLEPIDWLGLLRIALKASPHESGQRPSTKLKTG